MNAPTAQHLLAGLRATREQDQRTRLDQLLTATRWTLFVGAAVVTPAAFWVAAVAR